jgi:hypothetical protein
MKFLAVVWSLYGFYLLYQVYAWIKGRHIAVNLDIYNAFFIKKIGLALAILALSIILHLLHKTTLAKWIAGVPIAIAGIWLLIMLAVWLFTWFVMWWGSK